jgi:DNA-binding SARP family transcriptional activator
MKSYLAQGQRQLALRQYQVCIQNMKEELGVEPSQPTRALYHQIAQETGT